MLGVKFGINILIKKFIHFYFKNMHLLVILSSHGPNAHARSIDIGEHFPKFIQLLHLNEILLVSSLKKNVFTHFQSKRRKNDSKRKQFLFLTAKLIQIKCIQEHKSRRSNQTLNYYYYVKFIQRIVLLHYFQYQ